MLVIFMAKTNSPRRGLFLDTAIVFSVTTLSRLRAAGFRSTKYGRFLFLCPFKPRSTQCDYNKPLVTSSLLTFYITNSKVNTVGLLVH